MHQDAVYTHPPTHAPVAMTLRREGGPTALAMQEPSSTGSLAPWARRGLGVVLALACTWAGLALASHYPLSSTLAVAVWVAFAVACAAWPRLWLVAIPALLPIIGWAPWSGWITFEENDGLILAAAAAGYGRYAFTPSKPRGGQAQESGSPLVWLLVALLAASLATAMARGFADAGGFVFGLTQGYREPMNSVRLAKSLFAAVLLFPLWSEQHRQAPQQATQCLTLGLVLGLAGAALTTVWERAAFTGLLNFSTDYRTTALFWEMHVGGAALDGFLGLSVPFLARELLVAESRKRGLALGAIALLAAYACLTTFSRIVYLAVPVGLVVMLVVHSTRAGLPKRAELQGMFIAAVPAALWVAAFAAACMAVFPTSGYRGMLAMLGVAAAALVLPQVMVRLSARSWAIGLGAGALLGVLAWAISGLFAKGAYWAYAVCAAFTLLMGWWQARKTTACLASPLVLAGFVGLLISLALVARQWGGAPALLALWPVMLSLLVVLGLAAAVSRSNLMLWPTRPRWQGLTFGAMAIAGSVVAAFSGGDYMSERFASSSGDMTVRIKHWQGAMQMLRTPGDLWLGRGLGRFVDNYAFLTPPDQRPGDHRLRSEGSNTYLTMVAGTHAMGWGELLRMSQRIPMPQGRATVRLQVRTDKPTALHLEICAKHLLYDSGCQLKALQVPAKAGEWQSLQAQLEGDPIDPGPPWAPKLVMFSLATESAGHLTHIDNISLTDASGATLLHNGDFSEGLSRWFISSDRHHMPWHAKNVVVHVLLDQGLIGLSLLALLYVGALLRITLGPARRHPLAPGIAGALVAFLVVGMFDSLLDVPRLGFVFYFLLLLGLTLRTTSNWPGRT